MKALRILFIVLLTSLFLGCYYYPPPSYIKDVVAYQEGDGIIIYLILAGDNGRMTRAGGMLTLCIYQEDYFSGPRIVYRDKLSIAPSNFQWATVGQGAFAHKALIMCYGRISNSEMKINKPTNFDMVLLRVDVTFTTNNGKTLHGDTCTILL